MQKMIDQIVRQKVKGRNQKVAILVGRMDNDGFIKLGWSRVNVAAGDKFDAAKGRSLALDRTYAKETVAPPNSLFDDMVRFNKRCQRYFKDANGTYGVPVYN